MLLVLWILLVGTVFRLNYVIQKDYVLLVEHAKDQERLKDPAELVARGNPEAMKKALEVGILLLAAIMIFAVITVASIASGAFWSATLAILILLRGFWIFLHLRKKQA